MNIKTLFSILILPLLVVFSCKSINQSNLYYDLDIFLKTEDIDITTKKSILILNNEGCINCNKSFALLLQDFLNNDSIVIVNLANGTRLDISTFINNPNVLNIPNQINFLSGQIINSKAIFLKKNAIDTIVEIKLETIHNDLSFIQKKLKKPIIE
jgi:hypothetical protein